MAWHDMTGNEERAREKAENIVLASHYQSPELVGFSYNNSRKYRRKISLYFVHSPNPDPRNFKKSLSINGVFREGWTDGRTEDDVGKI